jgi:hypothetical protein
MSTTTEKLAAGKALRAWRAKQDTRDRPPGFDDDEAAVITGLTVETLDEQYRLGFVQPSVACWHEDEDGESAMYERYSELDLLRAMILADLAAAGVPKLALALAAAELEREHGDEDCDWRKLADTEPTAARHATAYPLTTATAERWLSDGSVSAILWTEANIADAEKWSAARAHEMRAEARDVRAALDAGEAVLCDARQAVTRLSAALDAWWVEHADDRPAPR